LPRLDEIRLDGEVLVFTLGVALFTALLFGSVAAFRSGGELARSLKEEGRGSSLSPLRRRARNGLVVAQIALALVLLVGSGLLLRTFQSLRQVDPGFARPAELLSFRLTVPEPEIADPKQVGLFYQSLAERLQSLPGVRSVGLASSMPMDGFNNFDPVFVEEKPAATGQLPPIQRMKMLGPGYFSTLGTPMLAGRDFKWSDLFELQRVTVVSESVARSQWGSVESALGKRVRESPEAPWREVVGVVADVREAGVDQAPTPLFYWPAMMENWWQQPVFFERSMVLVVRSERVGSPGFLDEVQRTVWSLNGNLPLSDVMTADRRVQGSMARTTFTVVMLAIAALTALLLGAIGTYGVVSYLAAQRTHEIGVRMAMGAGRDDVARLVLRHGLALAATGVGLGLLGAVLATRLLTKLLVGVSALDPLTYAVVAATVLAVALVASWAPARRASRLDPILSLRR
jgi:putative ABC transport system permease protein